MTARPANLAFDPATLLPLRRLIESAELSVARVLADAGLSTDFFTRGEAHLGDYFRLSERIALSMGDETIHISLRPLMLGTSDFIRDRLGAARTVGEMLTILADSYNVIHGARYNRIRAARGELIFEIDDADFPYSLDKDDPFLLFSLEGILVYIIVLLQSSSVGERAPPLRSIRTRRRFDPERPGPLGFWRVPIVQGAPRFALHYAREA
ncbi:MAG: hypothetical protein H7X93_13010, partial [Sphingomonadaceae bacterium]|nr:hypothetical protein [Sphingomonadaceae bacterium]